MSTSFEILPDRRKSDSIKWNLFGDDVLPMWVADMDFQSPQPVIDALNNRIKQGVFGYTCEPMDLKHAIQNWLDTRYKWIVKEEEIVFLPGVITGFNLACKAFTQTGDGYLIQTPVYPPFFSVANNIGIFRHECELHRDNNGKYDIDIDLFKAKLVAGVKVFLLCNPHNPVGRSFNLKELTLMADACTQNKVVIVSDEIHSDLVFPGNNHIPIASIDPEISKNTITLMSPSKTFNIAGLNCAFAIIQDEQKRMMFDSSRSGLVGDVNLLGQVAAIAAYTQGGPWLTNLINYLTGNRDFLYQFIKTELPPMKMYLPEATYLAWLDCRNIGLSGTPSEFFLKNSKVAYNDGRHFGMNGDGFIRLNFGCPRTMLETALLQTKKSLVSAGLL
jgi:cysteine-S-conjugate beta-lyase